MSFFKWYYSEKLKEMVRKNNAVVLNENKYFLTVLEK